MFKYITFIGLSIAACAIQGCKEEPIPEPTGIYSNLESALNEIAPVEQQYTFDATTGGTIIAEQGTQLIFGPHVLQNAAGDIIEGSVDVRIIEILDIEDMISSGVLPLDTDGNLLSSGGEIYVHVSQSGASLSIIPGEHYTISMPSNGTDAPMQFYAGTGDTETGMWSALSPIDDSTLYEPYYNILADAYTILTDIFGWLNCDALAEYGQVTMNIAITGLADVNDAFLDIYYLPDAIMSCSWLSGVWSEPDNTMTNVIIYDSPGNIVVSLVHDGNFYYGIQHVDPEAGMTLTIPVAESTLTDFEAALEAL